MIISYDGQDYQFSLDDVTVKQALKIEKFMGCPFAEWGKRLQDGQDLSARQALGWLVLHPDGGVPIEDTDFKMVLFGKALEAAYAAEEAASPEPRPTAAASNGRSDPGSSLATSQQFSDVISRLPARTTCSSWRHCAR